jgi:hypothetical protein
VVAEDADCDGTVTTEDCDDSDPSAAAEDECSDVSCADGVDAPDTSSLVILTAGEADAVCVCTGLTAGSVYVQATAEEAIDLSCIVEITESLEIDGTNASSVDFSPVSMVPCMSSPTTSY